MVYSSWSDSLHFVAIGDDPEDEAGSQHYNLQLHPGDHQFCIFSVSFSSDSKEILGGANDGCLYVYDREVNKQTSRIQAHRDDVNAVSFVDDTTHLLASGGDDGLVMVWDRRTLRQDDPRPVGVLAGLKFNFTNDLSVPSPSQYIRLKTVGHIVCKCHNPIPILKDLE